MIEIIATLSIINSEKKFQSLPNENGLEKFSINSELNETVKASQDNITSTKLEI